MRSDLAKAALPLLFGLGLTGCATDGSTNLLAGGDQTWGEANRVTNAAQIIDPMPHYDSALPDADGDHSAQAVARYRKGQVYRPEKIKTSSVSTGGGGGGNGSSGGSGGGSSPLGN